MSERSQNEFSLKNTDYLESINEKLQVHNEFWSYGENELVGHGEQTNAKCGTFTSLWGV